MDDGCFWPSILRALEFAPIELKTIHGFSGVSHSVLAGGYDEQRRRLVLVSGDADPRTAAFIQSDVQAAYQDLRVLVAKVQYLDNRKIADELLKLTPVKDVAEFSSQMTELTAPLLSRYFDNTRVAQKGTNQVPPALMEGIGKVMVQSFMAFAFSHVDSIEDYQASMKKYLVPENLNPEIALGICPFPLHEFSAEETEAVVAGANVERIQNLLREKGAFQYFFPAPDHLALGLIERRELTVPALIENLNRVSELGHPLGLSEITPGFLSVPDTISALQDKGLAVEGECSIEITPEGRTVRQRVVFKPREGLVSKILNRIKVNLDLGKWFQPTSKL